MSLRLPEHLDLIATAPAGIQKLRGLILELAVRGKLVPQDPSDEPASELLKRIAKERAWLEANGACKKSKPMPPVSEDEQPFALPIGWEWCRFPDVAHYKMGKTPPTKEAAYWADSGIPWVSISDMSPGQTIATTARTVSSVAREKVFRSAAVPAGTLLMSFKLTVGKVATLGIDAFHNEAIISIFPFEGVSKEFLSHFLPMIAQGGNSKSALMGDTLNSESLALLSIPLPPLAEQHRIVAKVDELMALCDRLEAEQMDAGAAHARLVATLLGTLTQSTDAADLAANWQRLADHFDTLFTTESSLDALKQTILQLALNGVMTNEDVFEKRKLQDLIVNASYGTSQKSEPIRPIGAYPVLRIPNVVRENLDLSDLKFAVIANKELEKLRLADGEILIVRTNGSADLVGRCAVVTGLVEETVFASYLIRLRFDPELITPSFAQLVLQNHRLQNSMVDFARTTAGQYNVSIGRLNALEMPLPSIEQQHRIVAKVDELIALCDRLKADLAESRTRQERLAATLIESALQAA